MTLILERISYLRKLTRLFHFVVTLNKLIKLRKSKKSNHSLGSRVIFGLSRISYFFYFLIDNMLSLYHVVNKEGMWNKPAIDYEMLKDDPRIQK